MENQDKKIFVWEKTTAEPQTIPAAPRECE
jgi:hypothetical protein